jgi:ABC-type antimicrobial peptide transport system permease subunit
MAIALFPAKAAAMVLAGLGVVGWVLTIAGLYGLVAYTVTRRIPEIGVRVALGAPPSNVMRLLPKDGLAIATVGVAAGLIAASLATPFLTMFLAGVAPHGCDQLRRGGCGPGPHSGGGKLRPGTTRNATAAD